MPAFDQSLPMMLYRTLDRVMPIYRELFAQFDLTEQQWRIMRVLWEAGNITSIDLARRCLIAPPSLVGILDRLEKRGLLRRTRSDRDRRFVFVEATSKGAKLQQEVRPRVDEIHDRMQGLVTQQEWQALSSLLSKIETGIDQAEAPEQKKSA